MPGPCSARSCSSIRALVHAILYVTGIPLVRPLFWAVGLAGTVMILLAMLGIIT